MKILLILLFYFTALNAFAQNYSFIDYSNGKGLPQSQVQCITQDDEGYLWVGTLGGLAKFNGKTFTPFSLEKGLYNNRISSLQYIQKTIWVGHEGGITQIRNRQAKAFSLGSNNQSVIVTDFILFKGKVVAATEGSGLFTISNNRITKIALPNQNASTCRDLEVINGKLYIGTRDGLYSTNDLISFNCVKAFGDRIISGIALTNKHVFISTSFEGLFQSDFSLRKFDSIPVKSNDLYLGGISSDKAGQLWLSTPEGIIRMSRNLKQLNLNITNGLPVNAINCSYQDKEGNMWFGSEGKGLLRFCGENLVYYNTQTGIPSDLILACRKMPNGAYIFGTLDKGAFEMQLNGIMRPIPNTGTTVWAIENEGDFTYFGTDEGLIQRAQNGTIKKLNFGEFNSTIRIVKRLRNGKTFVAGEDGIGWIENNNLKPEKVKGNSTSQVGSIRDVALYNGKLTLACSKGLFEYNEEDRTLILVKRFTSGVSTLRVDDRNRLWVGTENGLFIYDFIDYKPVRIGNNSGARFINFIEKDNENMYIGTNNGLYLFDAQYELIRPIKHIGLNSGLINLESNINSAFSDDHFFWFGTTEGLARLTIQKDAYSDIRLQTPQLSIVQILLNYQGFDYSDYSKKLSSIGIPLELRLPYTKNNISIDLDGILLRDPEAVLYQYWLEGQDENWSPPSDNSTILLSNLPDGEYILHFRTINELGSISNESSLPIFITPPFWRRWWFFTGITVLLIFGIRYYFRWKISQERERNYKENLENKSRLLALEQQSLNASMNRHFIFNSLNSIQYFINTQDRLSANRYLTNFAKLIRKNLDTAAEGDNIVSLAQELERLELYLSLESMRFKDRFTYEIVTNDIDTEQIIVPAMLLQPFVENSIIHGILPDESKLGIIQITVKIIGEQLEICLDDNGIGIEFSMNRKAKFQGDHKSQGMEITHKRINLIRKMWKKDYELIGPFQMLDSDSSIKGTRVLIKIPFENLD